MKYWIEYVNIELMCLSCTSLTTFVGNEWVWFTSICCCWFQNSSFCLQQNKYTMIGRHIEEVFNQIVSTHVWSWLLVVIILVLGYKATQWYTTLCFRASLEEWLCTNTAITGEFSQATHKLKQSLAKLYKEHPDHCLFERPRVDQIQRIMTIEETEKMIKLVISENNVWNKKELLNIHFQKKTLKPLLSYIL